MRAVLEKKKMEARPKCKGASGHGLFPIFPAIFQVSSDKLLLDPCSLKPSHL